MARSGDDARATSVQPWPEAVERVALYLRSAGAEARIEELESGTATAEAAAEAIGCAVAQVVKSLVVVCDGVPAVALVPGDRRGDMAKVARALGARQARVGRHGEVRSATGFAPGAVAPFPLAHRVVCDRSLLRHAVVWCGAGSDRHMVCLAPIELVRLARAELADLVHE
ncbi:MAG: YbaK/EbsC family protein [Thermoleophilia bacterium]|nr:YbaK/EbsC family protein [Thermoleophilia bacterium]